MYGNLEAFLQFNAIFDPGDCQKLLEIVRSTVFESPQKLKRSMKAPKMQISKF